MNWQQWIEKWALQSLFGLSAPADGEAEKLKTLDADFLKAEIDATNEADKKLAFNLHLEMHTRVITRELHYRSGDEQAALKSLHSLFEFSRDQIVEIGPDCNSIATIFTHVLNGRIERFTSKWHKKQKQGDFDNPEHRRVFRLELFKLQKDLFPFQKALKQFALGKLVPQTAVTEESAVESLGEDITHEYNIEENVAWPSTTLEQRRRLLNALEEKLESRFIESKICEFDKIQQAERIQIQERRKALLEPVAPTTGTEVETEVDSAHDFDTAQDASSSSTADATTDDIRIDDAIGLSFSGGGIRAGTFAMGVFQRLARSGMLDDVDYLSTVSGGGYFGSFLSTYLDTSNPKVGLGKDQYPFRVASNDEPESIRHIRNYASFLTNGAFHYFQIFGVVLFGLLTNLLLIFPLIVLAVILTKLTMHDAFDKVTVKAPGFHLYSLWKWIGLLTVLFGAFLSFVRTAFRGYEINTGQWLFSQVYSILCRLLLALFFAVTAINCIPYLVFLRHAIPEWAKYYLGLGMSEDFTSVWSLISAAVVPLVLRFLSGTGEANSIWTKVVRFLFVLSGPAFFLFSYLYLIEIFIVRSELPPFALDPVLHIWLFAVPVVVGVLLMNINFASPHLFYRSSLSNTFLIKPDEMFHQGKDGYERQDVKLMSELRSQKKELPYHLVNCVLNAPASFEPNLRGRNSDFYVFTEQYCGSPLIGFEKTTELEKLDRHLNLGTAMAISGAAASPHSGTTTSKESVFLMTLLNVRLGYWLRNPKRKFLFNKLIPAWFRHPTSRYLLSEMFGLIWEKIKILGWEFNPIYHNLSDGGHLENLGVYELLRRRCKIIIAVDGESDPDMHCESMMKLTRYARIDFGIEIYFDPKDFENQKSGFAKSHFTLGVIDYGRAQNKVADSPKAEAREFGIIIYLKNNLTGNESADILDCQKRYSSFPHVHISDQFFNEEQFEAFRSLGYHVADEALRPEIFDGDVPKDLTVQKWAEQLVKKLYPY